MFSDNLKKYRTRAKLTKSDMVKMLDLKYTTYDNYERGVAEPKIKTLIKIADIFKISIDELVDRTIKDKNEQTKTEINDILNTSDTKYLKLIDYNEKDITIGICKRDENFIHHAAINTRYCLSMLEKFKEEARKKGIEDFYDFLFGFSTREAVFEIQKQIKLLKAGLLNNISDAEKMQMLDDCLEQMNEIQEAREQYKTKFGVNEGYYKHFFK